MAKLISLIKVAENSFAQRERKLYPTGTASWTGSEKSQWVVTGEGVWLPLLAAKSH